MDDRQRHMIDLGLLWLVAFLVHVAFVQVMEIPIIQNDEVGYFGNARWLAGESPPPGFKYFPGYSLFLVPVFWMTSSTDAAYQLSLVVNAVLVSSSVPLAYALALRLGARGWVAGLATGTVAVFPGFFLSTNLVMSEVLLLPLTLAVALLVLMAVERGPEGAGWWADVGLAVAAGFSVVVHPRAVVVPGGALLALLVVKRRWRPLVRPAVLTAVVAGAGFALGRVVNAANADVAVARTSYPVGRFTIDPFSLDDVNAVATAAAGQLVTLVLSTFFVVPLAVILAIWSWPRLDPARQALAVYGASMVAVSLLLGGLFLSEPSRSDHLLYGRYVEIFVGPLLVLGVVLLARHSRRRILLSIPMVVAVTAMAARAVQQWPEGVRASEASRNNVLGILPLFDVVDTVSVLVLWAGIGVVAVAAAMAVWARPVLTAGLAVMVFAGITVYASEEYFAKGSEARLKQTVTLDALARLDAADVPVDCLAYDAVALHFWPRGTYRFYWEEDFTEFHSRRQEPPCDLVVSQSDLSAFVPEAVLLLGEDHSNQGLWSLDALLTERARELGLWTPMREAAAARWLEVQVTASAGGEITVINGDGSVTLAAPVSFSRENLAPTATVVIEPGTDNPVVGQGFSGEIVVEVPRSLLPGESVAWEPEELEGVDLGGAEVRLLVGDRVITRATLA